MKKFVNTLLATILAVTILTACGSSAPASDAAASGAEGGAAAKGTLTVGVAGDYYPFCFTENDQNQGFEIDLWNEFAARTDYSVDFMVSDFTGLLGMLDAGKVDTIGYGIAITPVREEKYLFSEPYLYSDYNLITGQDSTLATLDDFAGTRVGVVMGGEGERKLTELAEETGTDIEVVGYEGPAAMDEDIQLGRIDARVGPVIQTSANIAHNDLRLRITDVNIYSEAAGYPFPEDGAHEEMLADVDAFLDEIRADGTLAELSQKWFNLNATQA